MPQQKEPLVTICMPHWQVQELITLCLRAIRKFTTKIPIEVIVVDNGSEDESLDYLRGLKWIRLIERRKQDLPAFWVDGFVSALDIGFANSRSDYFIIMHTDTIVRHPGWLERMLEPMHNDPKCAASGAWKLEVRSPLNEFLRKITDTKKAQLWFKRTFLGEQKPDSGLVSYARVITARFIARNLSGGWDFILIPRVSIVVTRRENRCITSSRKTAITSR